MNESGVEGAAAQNGEALPTNTTNESNYTNEEKNETFIHANIDKIAECCKVFSLVWLANAHTHAVYILYVKHDNCTCACVCVLGGLLCYDAASAVGGNCNYVHLSVSEVLVL